jgi:hypothetical protein
MGNIFSGWHGGTHGRPLPRPLVENALEVPVASFRDLLRRRCRARGTLSWGGDHKVGWELDATLAADRPRLVLRYAVNGVRHDEIVRVAAGRRWYWECPDCRRRCGIFYLPLTGVAHFACRLCHGLVHRSSQRNTRPLAVLCRMAAEAGISPRTFRRLLMQRGDELEEE